ncbi:MAG: succinate dehydrogenase cytochrome b subunit [Chitinophagaceae bacterium]|jgi:succinate dehydrogenase / fumarate reductase cytochrome b subunit|nr:succinate dehydrogenase cytochrome b subunit [Chitinophagaceae bacterium]
MKWKQMFSSSIGKKITMALTGIFLIVFLVVHCYVNANVLFTNGEENFNKAAHFMSTNALVRIMEIGLFAGFILHIAQGYLLEGANRSRRSSKYAVTAGNKTSTWYSRSMALLGTLILLFLIIHLAHFWVPSRFGSLEPVTYGDVEYHNLYARMKDVFSQEWVLVVYLLGCFSLAWHLLHGFQSAFHTMGWNHKRYTPLIRNLGIGFSVIVPLVFALMPVFLYFGWELPIGSLTLLF